MDLVSLLLLPFDLKQTNKNHYHVHSSSVKVMYKMENNLFEC